MIQLKIGTRQLRKLLNQYTGGQLFYNHNVKEMASYIRHNFVCSNYTVRTLAKEFAGRR